MTYSVVVTPKADANLADAFEYIRERSPINAERWLRRMHAAIDRLAHCPARCPVAPESVVFREEIRHLIIAPYRVLFRIEESEHIVRVIHIRHGARRFLGEETFNEGV